ncbi:Uncharacterized protein DBV15_11540 [Temnothorax longispinosus]|uniref:Uncharacterized protein n=1 Tax=Temnothorax longispinosus TaxID=300112 RepID=A0A4S2KGH1_9HYME|nr:Uncharacterized protein DBV15_11540 [Temnothorax longispinosus]
MFIVRWRISERIGNTRTARSCYLTDHRQKPRRSFCKLTAGRRKCARAHQLGYGVHYTLALSQTGIQYRVRHLDITGDDSDAATGGGGRRATGGLLLLRFSDGTKESGVLCAVRLASADDSPRPPLFPMDKLYRVMSYVVEEVEEEEEEKTRNTFACYGRKERIKFEGEESASERGRGEQKERNSPLAGSKRKGRDEGRERRRGAEKDGECARVRSAAVTDERYQLAFFARHGGAGVQEANRRNHA